MERTDRRRIDRVSLQQLIIIIIIFYDYLILLLLLLCHHYQPVVNRSQLEKVTEVSVSLPFNVINND